MSLVFVDVEAFGACPRLGRCTWFGAVSYPERREFDGLIIRERAYPSKDYPAISARIEMSDETYYALAKPVYIQFAEWLSQWKGRPIFVSDNPAYDYQWINDGFWVTVGRNPFGHSARRISDYYAGLMGDFRQTQAWKRLRITPHDHNPVHDALGNVEAFERIQNGER